LKALTEEQRQLGQDDNGFTPDQISFTSVFTEGFARIQMQIQPDIDKLKNEKARIETEN